MEPIGILDVAARQVRSLAVRQAVVSGNIANVNTPGYRTREVETFKNVAERTTLTLAATDPRHLGTANLPTAQNVRTKRGGTVDIEREMLKAAEINREHTLATSLTKSFHRMLLAATRTGS